MPYIKTNWVDRLVEFANRFTKSNETATSVTLTADPGVVTQAGTPLSAANLNKIEQGIYDATVTADAALPKAGGTMTGILDLNNVRTRISGFDGVGNHWIRSGADDSDLMLNLIRISANDYRLRLRYGGVDRELYHSGNDGSGSGLDADTLDGLQAAAFALLSGATFTGAVGLPHFGGNGGFENGNGDAASYTSYNFALKGWWGLAMKTYDDSINGYYDFRTGKWDVKDGFYVNGTKIPPTRDNAGVLEFLTGGAWKPVGGVKSVQRGTTIIGSGNTVNATITAVNLSKAFLSISNVSSFGSGDVNVYARLTTTTNIAFTSETTGGSGYTIAWEVIESY